MCSEWDTAVPEECGTQSGRPGGGIHPLWFTLGFLSLAANPNLLMSLALEVKFLAVLFTVGMISLLHMLSPYETVSEFDQEAERRWLLWTLRTYLLEDLDIIGLRLRC